ncbi:MAG: hypothetical protein IJQ16_01970, partial [Selenomonadaceae bacterium]|nr:hypothetical protein [Selenomonadaceae bacterium]
ITPPSINEFSKRSGSEDNVTYAKFLIDHKKVNGKSTWYQITAFDGIEKISQAKAQNLFRQAEVFNLDNYVMYIDDAGDILKQTFAIVRRISIWQRIWEAKNDKNKQDRTYQKTVEISDKLWKGAISPYEANEELKKTIGSGAEEELQDLNNFIALGRTKFEAPRRNHLRFSHTGNGSTAIINLVDDRNLTEPHKLLQQFGESIGVNVQFFNNYNKNFHGAYENGTVYLNVNSARSLTSTFAHEIFHFLKESNPKLFEEIAKAAGITQEQLTNYLAETKREDVKETADITEEMIADAMQEILNRVARKDKSLVERFFAWLKDTLQKFKDIFNNPKGKLTRAQYARMADTFGKMAVKLKDADGNKIFRYNTRTHNLELANGESLDGLLEDTENEIYSSEEQGFFNWDSLSLAGAKLSATGNIDNAGNLTDNNKEFQEEILNRLLNVNLMAKIDDDMDILEVREKILRQENFAVGRTLKLYEKYANARKVDAVNLQKIYQDLKEAVLNANELRRNFNSLGTLQKVGAALQSANKGRTGSRLAETLRLEIDRRRLENSNGGEQIISSPIPGEYGGMYKNPIVEKIIKEDTNKRSENKNQGVFKLDSSRKNSIGSSGNTVTLGKNTRYSIGSSSNTNTSNDNSSEGFFQKVKNLLTGRPNQQNERIRKKIDRLLSNFTGVKIAAGHMNNGLDIVVKDVEKVIRTNRAYDWQNLLPAVGQKIATILKINSTPEMGNYIADWLMTGALNNTSAEAKSFEKALRDNPEIRENLLEIQSVFAKWRNMTPMEKAQATIEYEKPKPTLKERAKNLKQEGYQQFFEELSPVQDLVTEWEKLVGRKLPDAVNPYSLLRNYRGIAGRAKLFIEGGESTITAIKQMFPNINWDGFKTMKMILSDIGALDDKTIYKDFAAFAEAKHVKDIHLKNKEKLTAQRKVQDRIAELEEMKNNATDGKQIKRYDELIKKNQDKLESLKKSFYDTPMTEEVCDAIIRDYSAKYGDAQKELVKFSKMMLAILKNSGVISEQAYFNMLRDWKNYVPLHRVFDDNEDIKFGDSLKKMKGSSRDTVDPIQTIIRNTYDYIRRTEKNEAKLMLASMARTGGVGMLVEEVDGKIPDDKTTIMFYENGVKKYLQTDVSVVRAVNNMTPV